MSWFQGSISSITGQLSNLTKDILSETTEEIEDPETQLKLANTRIKELEVQLQSQRSEIERLQSSNNELNVKCESSEIQMAHLIEGHKDQLSKKEDEIAALFSQLQGIRGEPEGREIAMGRPSRNSTSRNGHCQGDRFEEIRLSGGEEMSADLEPDFASEDTFIGGSGNNHVFEHGPTNLLRQENTSDSQLKQQPHLNSNQLVPVEAQCEELENLRSKLLSCEDRHRCDSAALQEDHRRRISELKRQHQDQLEELTEKLEEVQNIQTDTEEHVKTKQRVEHLEQSLDKLRQENCELSAANDTARERLDQLLTGGDGRGSAEPVQKTYDPKAQDDDDENTVNEGLRRIREVVSENDLKPLVNWIWQVQQEFGSHVWLDQIKEICEHHRTLKNDCNLPNSKAPLSGENGNFFLVNNDLIGADSLSQFSDLSEISVHSRQLDEHVRQLATQIQSYEEHMERQQESMSHSSSTPPDLSDTLRKKQEALTLLRAKQESLRKKRIARRSTKKDSASSPISEVPISEDGVKDPWEHSESDSEVTDRYNDKEATPIVEEGERMSQSEYLQKMSHLERSITEIKSSNKVKLQDLRKLLDEKETELNSTRQILNHLRDVVNKHAGGVGSAPKSSLDQINLLVGEIARLTEEKTALREDLSNCLNQLKQLPALEEKAGDITNDSEVNMSLLVSQEINRLRQEWEERETAVQMKVLDVSNDLDSSQSALSALDEENMSLQTIINQMKEEICGLREMSGGLESEKVALSTQLNDSVKWNTEYQERIGQLETELEALADRMSDDNVSQMKLQEVDVDQSILQDGVEEPELVTELRSQVNDLQSELDAERLIEKYASGKEIEVRDDVADDVDILHREIVALKAEGENLRASIEQINEENAKLKSEIGRLIVTLSSQAEALSELNSAKEQLEDDVAQFENKTEDEETDMSKEAIRNLSKLVRDKEWEIEALRQKNESLLEVLQESGGAPKVVSQEEGGENSLSMKKLLEERENLNHQLRVFQQDREQLIAALNQKHHESISYHTEIQRLMGYINGEKVKWEEFENDKVLLTRKEDELRNSLAVSEEQVTRLRVEVNELLVRQQAQMNDSDPSGKKDSSTEENRTKELRESLLSREEELSSLQERFSASELSDHQQKTELTTLKKQLERVTFQLSESQIQISDLTAAESSLTKKIENQMAELEMLRDHNAQLSLNDHQRQQSPLPVHEGAEGRDVSEQISRLTSERDQLMMALRQKHTEIEACRQEISRQHEREKKLTSELQRLQDHLVQVEEGYTQEAVSAEDREGVLRERVLSLEAMVNTASNQNKQSSREAVQRAETLTEKLRVATAERDASLGTLARCQAELQQQTVAVRNLDSALATFQTEQQDTISFETERYIKEISRLKESVAKLTNDNADLANQLEAQTDVIEAAQRLSEQMDRKEAAMLRLQEMSNEKERLLDEMRTEIRRLSSTSDSKIDKELMKNLLVGYFHTPAHMKKDALRVIGNLLHFTDEDFDKIGVDTANKSGWFGWLRKGSSPSKTVNQKQESFTQSFVNFLERESRPTLQLRLPTEDLVADAERRSHPQPLQSSTNPSPSPPVSPTDGPHHTALFIPAVGQMWNRPQLAPSSTSSSTIGGRPDSMRNPLLSVLGDK